LDTTGEGTPHEAEKSLSQKLRVRDA